MAVTKGVTNAGIVELVKLSGNFGTPAAFTYIALGDGTAGYAATQTALGSEFTGSGLSRIQVTPTAATTTFAGDTIQWTNTFTVTGTATIKEIGILNNSASGDMLIRIAGLSSAVASGYTYTPMIKMQLASS
jgi:hypothetical protein